MLQTLSRPCGMEISVADPRGALARFYSARTQLANPALDDLQFKQVGTTKIWIMRKARREELKSKGE